VAQLHDCPVAFRISELDDEDLLERVINSRCPAAFRINELEDEDLLERITSSPIFGGVQDQLQRCAAINLLHAS
jgi:hypothetical protein